VDKFKYLLICIFLFTFSFSFSNDQKERKTVGVVLSGGGAKGIAHVGVLKVLEENNIPIDYICGTSIGAIVGGLYASGLSPDEILSVFQDEEFLDWMLAKIKPDDKYLFRKTKKDPTLLDVIVDEKVNVSLSPSIFPSHTLDFMMMKFTAQTTEACKNEFDSLFIPFFCVAADINKETKIVYEKGDLGQAIRASMSIPLVFEPLIWDSSIIVDGGVENNFPADILEEKYDPDYIIGSQVVKGNQIAKKGDFVSQIVALIMKNTSFEIPKEKGLVIQNSFDNVSVMDFQKHREAYMTGFQNALDSIERIKELIPMRETHEKLAKKRNKFRVKKHKLIYKGIKVHAKSADVRNYVRMVFNPKKSMDLGVIKSKFYKLIEDEIIEKAYVLTKYDEQKKGFVLHIYPELKTNSYNSIGFNFATNDILEFYYGFSKNFFFDRPLHTKMSFSIGSFNKFIDGEVKTFFNTPIPFYSKLNAQLTVKDYHRNDGDYIYNYKNPTNLEVRASDISYSIGFPISRNAVLSADYDFSAISGDFKQHKSLEKNDETLILANKLSLNLYSNSLDNDQYPTDGDLYELSFAYKNGNEKFEDINNSLVTKKSTVDWTELKISINKYKKYNSLYSHGVSWNGWLSNRPLFSSYFSELILNPKFIPNNYFETIFNPDFVSSSYASLGYHNIFHLNFTFQLRNSLYVYFPIYKLNDKYNETSRIYEPVYDDALENVYFYNNTSLIQETLLGPISLELNTFYADSFKFHLVFNFGFRIFRNSEFFK
jgi:NTE family protein